MRHLATGLAVLIWASWLVAEAAGGMLFEDGFDDGEIANGWSWLREAPRGWDLSGGKLKIRTTGSLWESDNTQPNLLLRAAPVAPAAGYAVEVTVSNRSDLTERYEHGGLIWYLDDDNWVTLTQLNHVQHKTQKIMLVHETEGEGRAGDSKAAPFTEPRVDLRLVVEGRQFTGYYRKSKQEEWRRLGSITFPRTDGSPRLGLTAGQGPDTVEHWVSFDDFGIRRLDSGVPP